MSSFAFANELASEASRKRLAIPSAIFVLISHQESGNIRKPGAATTSGIREAQPRS